MGLIKMRMVMKRRRRDVMKRVGMKMRRRSRRGVKLLLVGRMRMGMKMRKRVRMGLIKMGTMRRKRRMGKKVRKRRMGMKEGLGMRMKMKG